MVSRSMRVSRGVFRGVVVVAGCVVMAGCSDGPLPPEPRPEVLWVEGEPSGPLEDDPWVRAVRAADLENQVAITTRDFSRPVLEEISGGMVGRTYADVQHGVRVEEWIFSPGSTPMIPVHVEEAADGQSATVAVCVAVDWRLTADDPEPPTDLRGALVLREVSLVEGERSVDFGGALIGEDAARRGLGADVVDEYLDPREGSTCKLDDAAVGLFDPQPDVTLEYSLDDIKTATSDHE